MATVYPFGHVFVLAVAGEAITTVAVTTTKPTAASFLRMLGELLSESDLLDGVNSRWTDDEINAAALGRRGIGFVD